MNRRQSLKALSAVALTHATIAPSTRGTAMSERPSDADLFPTSTARSTHRRSPSAITTRDGLSLYYRDWGSGRPLVFVHAWAMNADFFDYQMNALSRQGYRCIAFDQRGCGRSGDAGRGYDYATLTDDIGAVLEQLDLRDVTLIGHSMGGAQAVRYCTTHGSRRVSRLVLIAPMTPYLTKSEDNPEGVDVRYVEATVHQLATDRAAWLRDNARPFFMPDTPEATLRWAEGLMLQASLRAMIDTCRVGAATDLRPDLRALRLPTLILHGTADHSIPFAFGQRTAELVQGSRLITYDSAPHGLVVTHAARVTSDIAGFASG